MQYSNPFHHKWLLSGHQWPSFIFFRYLNSQDKFTAAKFYSCIKRFNKRPMDHIDHLSNIIIIKTALLSYTGGQCGKIYRSCLKKDFLCPQIISWLTLGPFSNRMISFSYHILSRSYICKKTLNNCLNRYEPTSNFEPLDWPKDCSWATAVNQKYVRMLAYK